MNIDKIRTPEDFKNAMEIYIKKYNFFAEIMNRNNLKSEDALIAIPLFMAYCYKNQSPEELSDLLYTLTESIRQFIDIINEGRLGKFVIPKSEIDK
jgi:hypothetical protein